MKTVIAVVVASGSMFLASIAFAEELRDPKEPKVRAPQAETAGRTAPQMIVVRDPDTGQLRAPTAKEIEALSAARVKPALATAATATPSTTVETLPSGRIRAQLGPEYFRYSVVRKNPDGSLSSDCVPASKVDEAVNASAPAAKPALTAKPAAEKQ